MAAKRSTANGGKVGEEMDLGDNGYVRLPDGSVTGHHGSYIPRVDGEHVFTDQDGNEVKTVNVSANEAAKSAIAVDGDEK